MKRRLLAHVCCASCCRKAVEILKDKFDLTLFFYNPALQFVSRVSREMKEIKQIADPLGILVVDGLEGKGDWEDDVLSVDASIHRHLLCLACIDHTLDFSAREADRNGIDCFASTLSFQDGSAAVIADEKSIKYSIGFLDLSSFGQKQSFKRHSDCSCKFSCFAEVME